MTHNMLDRLRGLLLRKTSHSREQRPSEPPAALYITDIVLAIVEVMPLADIIALAMVSKFHMEILRKYLPKLKLPEETRYRVNRLPLLPACKPDHFRSFCLTCSKYHVWTDASDVRKLLCTGSPSDIMHRQQDPSKDVKINSHFVIPDICIQLLKRGLANSGLYRKSVDNLLEYVVGGDVIDPFFAHEIALVQTRNNGLLLRVVSATGKGLVPRSIVFSLWWSPKIRALLCDCDQQALGRFVRGDAAIAIAYMENCRTGKGSCSYREDHATGDQGHLPKHVQECQLHCHSTHWRCPTCTMVVVVGWHHGYNIPDEDLEKSEHLQRRKFKQHALSITRYVDLGPIAAHDVTPEWFATHRREEMLAMEYGVTSEGQWRYTGHGGAKQRFRMGRFLHEGLEDYERRLLEQEKLDKDQADRFKLEYRRYITTYSVTSSSARRPWVWWCVRGDSSVFFVVEERQSRQDSGSEGAVDVQRPPLSGVLLLVSRARDMR